MQGSEHKEPPITAGALILLCFSGLRLFQRATVVTCSRITSPNISRRAAKGHDLEGRLRPGPCLCFLLAQFITTACAGLHMQYALCCKLQCFRRLRVSIAQLCKFHAELEDRGSIIWKNRLYACRSGLIVELPIVVRTSLRITGRVAFSLSLEVFFSGKTVDNHSRCGGVLLFIAYHEPCTCSSYSGPGKRMDPPPSKTQSPPSYLCRHIILDDLFPHDPVVFRVFEAPLPRVCRLRCSGNTTRPLVDTHGTDASASSGSVARAQKSVGCATLVTLDRAIKLVGGSTEALMAALNRGRWQWKRTGGEWDRKNYLVTSRCARYLSSRRTSHPLSTLGNVIMYTYNGNTVIPYTSASEKKYEHHGFGKCCSGR